MVTLPKGPKERGGVKLSPPTAYIVVEKSNVHQKAQLLLGSKGMGSQKTIKPLENWQNRRKTAFAEMFCEN